MTKFRYISRKELISNLFFIFEIITMFIMSSFFVPTVDDLIFRFNFKYDNFSEFVNYVAYYGNGRLLGNGLLLYFSNHTQLFYALQTLLTAILAVLIEKIINLKYSRHYVIAFFIFQPLPILSTTFSWMSAYINYYIPVIFLSITTLIILSVKKEIIKTNFLFCIIIFILGITQQLFVETNATINTIISLGFIFYFHKIRKNITLPIILFISNIIGLAIILLFTKFIDISKTFIYKNSQGNYRGTIFSGSIFDAVFMIVKNFRHPIFFISIFAFFFISCILVIIYTAKKREIFNLKIKLTLFFSIISYIPLCIITLGTLIKYPVDLPHTEKSFLLLICLIVLLCVISYSLLLFMIFKIVIKPLKNKIFIFITFGLGILSFLPFLVVSPASFRVCELSMIFIMISYLLIIKEINKTYGFDVYKFNMVCATLSVIVMILYSFTFAKEKKIFNYKEEYYATMKYLPHSNEIIVMHGDNESIWNNAAGFEHEFISLKEFENMISK